MGNCISTLTPTLKSVKSPQEFGISSPNREELKELLEPIETVNIEVLTHIGDLDNPSQSCRSLEGLLLSTSEFPHEWEEIAKLGGLPWWEISAPQGINLLEMLSPKESWKKLEDWAESKGLLYPKTLWVTPFDTDEDGETRIILCKSKKEAEDNHDPEAGEIEEKIHLLPSQALWDFWSQRQQGKKEEACAWRAKDALCAALLELAAQNRWSEFPDGLHWNENLDPTALSAPRAGLCPSKIKNPPFEILPL